MNNQNEISRQLSDGLLYLFNTGKLYHAYETFGAHITDDGVQFTVWAPDVKSVRVIGEFNDWGFGGSGTLDVSEADSYLEPWGSTGVFTGFIPGMKDGDCYKFEIETASGQKLVKADPFAFGSELRPATASRVTDLSYEWNDDEWMEKREKCDLLNLPMNIYEVHLGSWKRHPREDGFYSYRELADSLIPYVKEMGYTHIECLPLSEHPLDASWGYQVTGYYAATARYGRPVDLMYFIDKCHEAGIGVILDWVPGHFCPDAHGLANFNGTQLFESEIHPDWGTYKFDFGRNQVRSFLLSNAMFWLKKFHIDGLRVDGVSSMLYLNFGVSDPSKRKFNKYGDEGNLEAISFLQEFNHMVGTYCPGVFTAAEESSAWPLVTRPPEMGGLGFHFKWNMGWMNDTLDFMSKDYIYRSYDHHEITFSMTYAFAENHILPLSHDEVVHGKRSLIGRMPGDIWRQFAGIRLLAMYQMTHPGKKLNFMGHEIAQFIEWREYEELQWFLLQYENHAKYQEFIKQLNHVYMENHALWKCDNAWNGFQWIDSNNESQNILSFMRFEDSQKKDGEVLAVALNFNVQSIDEFRLGVACEGEYEEIFNSDAEEFGGNGRCTKATVEAEPVPMHGYDYSIVIRMPVLGGIILKRNLEGKKKDDKNI
ncbi:MAG: 1,4-alpha-glucan branching protein GlgB [Lachnospiraceae bacterium]|jgi:1,4-alpha-glucan branching enzyme